ncbi:bacteriophage holin [Natronobiforma cellulositropha]|uniref:bacteriophage holin n=1 Tax=Natronobiforma cellulositropha TaxID=1679076 RepID=UPI0021D606BF|nr:bacteriophage holin [Natronobiforma cellulositropha]
MDTPENTLERPIDSIALGFALASAWGLAVAVLGFASRHGWGTRWRALLSDVYVGFEPGRGRTSAGVAWAAADGFLGGVAVGWLYNVFTRSRADSSDAPVQETASSTAAESAAGSSTTTSAGA